MEMYTVTVFVRYARVIFVCIALLTTFIKRIIHSEVCSEKLYNKTSQIRQIRLVIK